MTLMSLILAILEAIPILDKWFQGLALKYTEVQVEKNNEEFKAALELAKTKKDTTELRKSLGNKLRD